MPAFRIADKCNEPVEIHSYDVIGEYSSTDGRFVWHIGVSVEEHTIRPPAVDRLAVSHMRPPLRSEDDIALHCVGSAQLTADEISQIRLWIQQQQGEHDANEARGLAGYVICPQVLPYRGRDGTRIFDRYSCAGFVIEVYRWVEIDLVETEEERLPAIDLHTLHQAYPDLSTWLGDERRRSKFGLSGDGPWPVILCGYILHSLNRDVHEIRRGSYLPTSGDELF